MAPMIVQNRKDTLAQTTQADVVKDAAGGQRDALRGMTFDDANAALAPVQLLDKKAAAPAAKEKEAAPKKAKSFGATDPNGLTKGMHPTFQTFVTRVIEIAHGKGLDIWVTQGMRTIGEQNELYKQGRTKAGKVVTWARGGESYHNYGLGVDFAFHGGKPYDESHDWAGLVASVEAAGLESGASYGDRPHGNLKGVSIGTLQKWHAAGGMANVWNKVSELAGGPTYPTDEKDTATKPDQQKGGGGGEGYKVKPGDTLVEIAKRMLGDGKRWEEIAELNGVRDPRALQVGATLKLPKTTPGKEKSGPAAANDKAFTQTDHTVRGGDTLTALALKYYGISSLWTEIAAANGITDPAALKVGQKLVIPNPGSGMVAPKKPVAITHVVKPGETLTQIAVAHYGDAGRWTEIARANSIKNTRSIAVGTKLTVPM